jgi:hypothetical protein
MSLECLNTIISNNLAIQIDLTDVKSWIDFNKTGLTAVSLTKWTDAVSDNIDLIDFGLTAFDNGRTNIMWSGITLTPNDTLFTMYKIGYNSVLNPTTGQTSGLTATTHFLPITGITASGITNTSGNYFNLNGGYLQGFFKLHGYDYTLFPPRCNTGITIETILNIYPNSQGIFYMMGARAEDKYNPYFSGETITGRTYVSTVSRQVDMFEMTVLSGVTTTDDNYLNAIQGKEVNKIAFRNPENDKRTDYSEAPQVDNIRSNAIAFEITPDKRLGYKYINDGGLIIKNSSSKIFTHTGFTIITITFTPDNFITGENALECVAQRIGTLVFYVNGRAFWTINNFPEPFFHEFKNDKEKQLGAPYSISWGGGSFGLEHSWHYDYQTYVIYMGQNSQYVNNNFIVQENPEIGNVISHNFSLSANSTTFNETVMQITYTGGTGNTGNTYFVKFNHPVSVLSNRDYCLDLSLYVDGLFKSVDSQGNSVSNKISLVAYSDTSDITIISEIQFVYPLTEQYLHNLQALGGLHPFLDRQEYEYIYSNGLMYYGASGLPVVDENGNFIYYDHTPDGAGIIFVWSNENNNKNTPKNTYISSENVWCDFKTIFIAENGSGQNFTSIGLLIESSDTLNVNGSLFLKDFTYTASDILVEDVRKNNLLIEQNYNSPFIGGIQKLRLYDTALTSADILHNAIIESKTNPNILVSKGGRIIYR